LVLFVEEVEHTWVVASWAALAVHTWAALVVHTWAALVVRTFFKSDFLYLLIIKFVFLSRI
jgi:hypothetical protein